MTATLMLQGTGSDVGKSLVVAGLARAFTRRGLAVRPFKPQNMSNNAAVTPDGGEIGRAQALQARACGVAPSVHMNPVLLKPQSEIGAQIVVQGQVEGNAKAAEYHALKPELMPRVLESFERLKAEADLILVEGAGSPAEVNIREGDIANMGFALEAGVPVILVADIDRGGVLASLAGTHMLIEAQERALLRGYLVNKFRGDKALFMPAVDIVARRTGMICHGVIPWFAGAAALPAEDAVALDKRPGRADGAILIAVPRLSRIANFDDLDPLAAEPDVAIDIVESGRPIPAEADLVLLPGSKSTIPDLAGLREQGWDIDIKAHLRRGKPVMGLCAGYQMLGTRLDDPEGTEGPPGAVEGLGLLDIETVLTGDKRLVAYLVAQGHRRIAYVSAPLNLVFANYRLAGYREALSRAGLPYDESLVVTGGLTDMDGYEAGREFLQQLLLTGRFQRRRHSLGVDQFHIQGRSRLPDVVVVLMVNCHLLRLQLRWPIGVSPFVHGCHRDQVDMRYSRSLGRTDHPLKCGAEGLSPDSGQQRSVHLRGRRRFLSPQLSAQCPVEPRSAQGTEVLAREGLSLPPGVELRAGQIAVIQAESNEQNVRAKAQSIAFQSRQPLHRRLAADAAVDDLPGGVGIPFPQSGFQLGGPGRFRRHDVAVDDGIAQGDEADVVVHVRPLQ